MSDSGKKFTPNNSSEGCYDDEPEDESEICGNCNGSGEGYDGSTCSSCCGLGEPPPERDCDDYEPPERDDSRDGEGEVEWESPL